MTASFTNGRPVIGYGSFHKTMTRHGWRRPLYSRVLETLYRTTILVYFLCAKFSIYSPQDDEIEMGSTVPRKLGLNSAVVQEVRPPYF